MLSGAGSELEANILIKSGQLPTRLRLIQLQLAYVNYLRIAALEVILIRVGGQKERLAALILKNLRLYRGVRIHLGCKCLGARVMRQC